MTIRYFSYRAANLFLFLLLLLIASQPVHAGPASDSSSAVITGATPRTETLYFNGLQWGPVYGWNPYSTSNNNSLAISQDDNTLLTVWETPYMYNMLDGNEYPLLADGPLTWNAGRTSITFKIKSAAKWSDGTPVTAQDVAYTWATHLKYGTNIGYNYHDYISNVIVVDPQTVKVDAQLDGDDKPINPLLVEAYLNDVYVVQKAWTQTLEARSSYDAGALQADTAEDFVASGPYMKYFVDDTKVVLVRNNNYWGQNVSMWGKLPVPKYLAHVIYPDNDAGMAAFKAGQVDVSQQFIADEQNLWLVDHLPVSTYLPNAPYQVGASLPTAFYNLHAYGLDQLAVRKAIAMAVNYDQIITDAMTNQSATFSQVPRSLMNPSAGEQALYDHAAVAGLQWTGNDIAGAKAILDTAGIKDTNGDGWREYNGKKLSYVATCPNGWVDWQAAIELVAAAGRAIGIDMTTNYPEWSDYQMIVTASDQPLPAGYDIFMMWSDGAGPTQPWSRIRHLMSSEFVGMPNNWNGNWGGYVNPAVDTLIQAIPRETDPAVLKADYTELTRIYLTDIPSFTLMYRPQQFHTVNESYWTGFPKANDGTNPPVPPLDLVFGYSIAGLYHLDKNVTFEDVPPSHMFWKEIEAFYDAGITTGCSADPMKFCPLNYVTRQEMAVFLERAMGNFNPSPNPSGHFTDVPAPGAPAVFTAFIDQFYNDGITTGCATNPARYCPLNKVTRQEMAVFIERAMGNFAPDPNPSGLFSDVPAPGAPAVFTDFIDQFYNDGITTGCAQNPLRYCPLNKVTRQEMAVFIVRAFHLPLP